MNVGSLVICIDDSISERAIFAYENPKKDKIYTIREILYKGNETGVRLEEIKGRNFIGRNEEIAFRIERFRELQPPITNIEQHIKENTYDPQLS